MASRKQKIICIQFSLFLVILFGSNTLAINAKVPSIITVTSEDNIIIVENIHWANPQNVLENIPLWSYPTSYHSYAPGTGYLTSIEAFPLPNNSLGLGYKNFDDLVIEYSDGDTWRALDDDEGLYNYPKCITPQESMSGVNNNYGRTFRIRRYSGNEPFICIVAITLVK